MIWPFVLSLFGVVGLYLAGRKLKSGWAVGLVAQVVWIVYAVATEQWGFIPASIAYGYVYARNWWAWRREEPTDAP